MIFDTPNLRSGTGYPGDPTSLGEVFDVSNRGQYHIESVNALHSQIEEEYTARIKAIKDAAGVDFVHPLQTDPNVDRLMARANQRGRHWFNKQDILETQLEEASERLQELQKKHPDLADIIKADTPPHLDVYRRMRKIEGERGDVLTRRGLDSISGMLTDPIGTGAMFTGALWGMRNSPYDLLALVAGGAAGRPTYSLLRNALINATANAAAQALVEPAIQRNRAMAGLDAGWQQAMGNIAMAFGIGGTLDLAVRTPGRAFRWWQGQPNVGGVFLDAPTPVAPDFDPAPRAPVPRLPEIPEELISRAQQGDVQAMMDIAEMVSGRPVELPEGVSREMIGKALDGDPEALTQVIERSGMAEDPAIKGALDRFILEGGDAEVQTALQRVRDEFAGVTTPEGGRIDIDIGQDEQRILQALRAAMDPDEPMPTGGMELTLARRAALADDEPLPRGIVGTNQHELKIDIFGRPAAVRELDLKLTRLEGEVEALSARQWSDDLAGRVLAFEPRDGALVIMDGRRRAELAQRIPGEARAEAIVFREADGWTRQEVSALAQRKNIAEGRGSPVELAEALKASPDLLDLIDTGTGVTRAARSLAMLSDDAFGMVKAGEADPRMAAMVSDMVANDTLHAQLLRDLRTAGIEDLTHARRSLNDLLPYQSPHEANAIMLGFEPDDMPLRAGADVEDPKGPAAKAQVQRLERELAPEIADARAKGPPPPTPAETAAVAAERAATARTAIEQVVGRMPEDFRVETFSAIGDLPDALQAEVMRGNAVAFSNALSRVQAARTPAARARAMADLEAAKRGEGVEGFERDGVVYVAAYAANPEAVVWHEIVHFLKRTGRLTDDEIALLARRARKENLFDEGLYREAMDGRDDLDAKLDEEAAAHLMQARKEGRSFGRKTDAIIDKALRTLEMIGNALRGYGFRTADDVIEAVLSGEMARREAVRAVMRQEDVTAFAMRSAGDPRDTDAFKRWFGDSKVVDENGEPLVMYHGTTNMDRILEGGFKKGWVHLSSSRDVADGYKAWDRGDSAGTLEVYVKAENPAYYDAEGARYVDIGNKIFNATWDAERAGHDALIVTNIRDPFDSSVPTEPHTTVVAFSPTQIKSVANRGTFDPNDPRIMFAFAGERARTADLDALSRAKEMETQGKDRTAIWTATGWFKGVDGKWRFEIDDGPKWLQPEALDQFGKARLGDSEQRVISASIAEALGLPATMTVPGLLRHPNLFETYPDLAHIRTSLVDQPEQSWAGRYLPAADTIELNEDLNMSTTLHEVQHAIQEREATARGGNPQMFTTEQIAAERARRIADPARYGWRDGETMPGYVPDYNIALDLYRRLAGEVEARTVERRLDYTPEQRKARPPWEDYDVPEDQQIVRMGDGAMFSLRRPTLSIPGLKEKLEAKKAEAVEPRPQSAQRGEWVEYLSNEQAAAIDGILAGDVRDTPVVFASIPPVLGALGVTPTPVALTDRVVWKSVDKHHMRPDQIKTALDRLQNPLAVFDSATTSGGFVVVVDLPGERFPAVVAIHPNQKVGRIEVSRIASIHTKNGPGSILNWMEQGLTRYINMRDTDAWVRSRGLQLPKDGSLKHRQGTKVLQYRDVFKGPQNDKDGQGGPMFSLRSEDVAPGIDIPALAQRLLGIADTYRAAVSGEILDVPDIPGLSLGRSEDGLITSVDVGGETYFVARDEAGNITGLMSPDQATERAIADTIETTARDAGYELDPERVSAYTAEAMAIVRTAQEDPQGALQAASDLIARISDEITPDEPALRADNDNEIPAPLRQDLADVDRLNGHAELVSVCRAF